MLAVFFIVKNTFFVCDIYGSLQYESSSVSAKGTKYKLIL